MIGFITCSEKGVADRLLADLAETLRADGCPVVALVRADVPARFECEMHLRLLPDDRVVTISQELGAGADACTLDAGALEMAVAATEARISEAPEGAVLILNKFGKQEAAGRGVRGLIGQGLEAGMRVVLSAPPETRADFLAFAGEMAEELRADAGTLRAFATQATVSVG
ncbi:DUF2478 domain-containing protein [Pseudothioclava nitratireducens]|jgi:hypothetical protein|uniref:DUF2478 domain-containing protein n=1 Tax=Pseudothioclava nitratireducens TaxID=1928646 RepID=UPI0023DA0638|nr:DUF2478 domain-containing protein [Defluviimonas nitratireducens]MDF1619344.1 DUF2478 domain-containing protein [Defluviimonas nitratireducens]